MPTKYLGSKRKLIDPIMSIVRASGVATALNAFTGTTRVAQAMKREGLVVIASDVATYSKVFADCYIATDAGSIDMGKFSDAISRLNCRMGAFRNMKAFGVMRDICDTLNIGRGNG